MKNLIDLTNFLNIKKQVGGSYTKVRIWYFKNYNLTPPVEQFNKIFLVTDKYIAYEMNNLIQNNTYFLELNIPNSEYFKFKFMRDDKLEYLSENGVLKGLTIDPSIVINAKEQDVHKHIYSWRFIKINDKLITDYFFSYCIPLIEDIDDNIITTDVVHKYGVLENMTIQKQQNIITESRKVIPITDVSINVIGKPLQNIMATFQIANHNLGNNILDSTINSILPDDLKMHSCYNNNLLLYMEYLTLNNYSKYNTFLDILGNQTKYFFDQYNTRVDGDFYSIFQKYFEIKPSLFADNYLYFGNSTLLSTNLNTHLPYMKNDKTQIAYQLVIGHPYLNSYNIKLLDLDIQFDTHIKIIQNPIVEFLEQYVFTHLKAALQIHSGKFNKLPLSLRDYKLFFDNYKQTCINQIIKFMFIDMLMDDNNNEMHFLENNYQPSNGSVTLPQKNDKLEINGYTFTYDEYMYIHGRPDTFTDPNKKSIIERLKEIKTNIKTSFSSAHLLYSTGTKYQFSSSIVYFNSYIFPKEFYQDVNEKYLLTVSWINKYIAPLVYNINVNGDVIVDDDGHGNITYHDDKSIIKQLYNIFNNNIDITQNTVYKYFIDLYQSKDIDTDHTAIKVNYKNILKDRVNYNGNDFSAIGNDYESYKDKKYSIYAKMVQDISRVINNNDTNNLLSLVPDKISLFTKYYWYDLNDIDKKLFIESLSSENQVKLYAKLLVIFSYLLSPNCSRLMTDFEINGKGNFDDTSSIEYIKTIEENETINNLLKLSLYHIYTRQINVKCTKTIIENDILNLKLYIKYLESSEIKSELNKGGVNRSFKQKIDELPIYIQRDGSLLTYVAALENLLNGITNNENFVTEIDRRIKLLADRINIVNNLDVIKLELD